MGIATLDDPAVLRDGSTARLRTVQSGDEAALREFLDELSIQSRAFRFFTGAVDLGRARRGRRMSTAWTASASSP